jgi:phosphoribosylformylglycinamidine synthase PurS subunit
MRANVNVTVHLRPEILDPEGKTIEDSLPALGFAGVFGVRVGKSITFEIEGPDRQSIEATVRRMCEEFLANPVIEEFSYSIDESGESDGR